MGIYANDVQKLYIAYFNRPADPVGLAYWEEQITNNGGSAAVVANAFSASAEYKALYDGKSSAQIVDAIYQNLFGRSAEASGLTYWALRLENGTFSVGNIAMSIMVGAQNDDKKVIDNKVVVATSFTTALDTSAEILAYTGSTAASAARTFLATVGSTDASLTTAKAAVDSTIISIAATPVANGSTFTLTSGVDLINGTAGNDTLIADNTDAAKVQLAAADQINGGAGTDTLKVYVAAAATGTGQPTLTGIEEVYINGGAITAYTAATGTTKLSIDAASANVAATYTLSGQDLVLANKISTAATTTTVAAGATSTHTTQKVTLNGITRDAVANATTIDISGTKIATLNLEATGANSNVALTNTGAAITALNFTGDKSLTVTAAPAAIVTVNASAATGALNYTAGTAAGTFKFTGGAGNDSVTFANDGLAALISGAQLDGGAGTDKLGITDAALTATETARINQVVGFETLGLNAGITLDASTLTTIKSFAVDTAGLTLTVNSMATGSTTAINANTTSLTLGSNVGVTDTGITIGGTAGGVTATALVTTGITNVTLTSNGVAANAATLTNSDNSVFTLKGAADLTLALAAGTAVGSKIDGSAATGKLTLTGSSITTSGDIVIGGAAADTINGGKGADTLTGGAGVDTFTFTASAGANASGGTFGQADVITDFVVGTDKLQFSTADIVSVQQGAVQTAVTALAAGSTATAIATAMAAANSTNLGVSFAVFEGSTYVLYETSGAGAGVAADDVFIKLVGITTLPTFAADVIA